MKIGALITLLMMVLLAACSNTTMTAAECGMADWQLIGFEDGSLGYDRSRIGEHRRACAEYGVSPDLNAYEMGHSRGVRNYCTWDKGFGSGRAGNEYNGICPADLEADFLGGFDAGREIYLVSSQLRSVESDIGRLDRSIRSIERRIAEKEDQIASDETTPEQRRTLLAEIEALRAELLDNGVAIGELQVERDILEQGLQELESQY